MTAHQPAKAMILAAGKGMRMGAMSDHTPKPLVKVHGKSILRRAITKLESHGISRFVVNVHHLADMIMHELKSEIDAGISVISDERNELLETGGGVKKAIPHLADDHFFVLNCDVIWSEKKETVLSRLEQFWDPARMDVLLLMVPFDKAHGYDGVGDFFMDQSDIPQCGPLQFRGDADSAPLVFGAVQIVKAKMYDGMPDGSWSNREIFRKAAANGRLFGLLHTDSWFHVGTQAAIAEAEAMMIAESWSL